MKRKSPTCVQHRAALLKKLLAAGSRRERTFKQRAHDLVDQLPDNAGWCDLIYLAGVRLRIERDAAASDAAPDSGEV